MRLIKHKQHAVLSLPSLRLEGSLLLPDQLEKAALGKADHQSEADYQTPKGLKLKDDYSRAFQIAVAQWKHFSALLDRQDVDATQVTTTFVQELLRDALAYHNLADIEGIVVDDRHFPVPFLAGHIPVVVAPHTLGLDDLDVRFAIAGGGSRKKSPFQLMQELLNASPEYQWGIASNGKQLRLLRDAATLTRPSFLEIDLQDLLGGQRFAEFAMFWRLLHASRAGSGAESSQSCIWELWRSTGQQEGTRVREGLRTGVTQALLTLGTGFLQYPANEVLRRDLLEGRITGEQYFQQLLRLIYRMIFLFTVEERGLLHPVDESEPTNRARRAYAEGYAFARLRDSCLRRRAYTSFDDIWNGLRIVFRGLAEGEPRLALPALGGLFARSQCSALDASSLTNANLLKAIRDLRWDNSTGALAPVDYRNMGPEELGSVYESLLELVPEIEVPARHFGFAGQTSDGSTQGNARKISGSYYTPDSLVQELIKSALDPLIEQRLIENPDNPIGALLNIKVIDPACGSGHFLLAAARRLAERLAALRSTEGAIKPQDYRHALREVISRCIFGVDRNPMALELCRTALWLEGFEEGRPLSFLDHHLQCGDALLGLTDLKTLETGISQTAYKPLSGDDKATCQQLARDNKAGLKQLERDLQRRQILFQYDQASGLDELKALEDLPIDTPADIAARELAYETFLGRARQSRLVHAADLLVGAFLMQKTEDSEATIPTSQTLYLELFSEERSIQHEQQLAAAREVCREARVLHWPLAFPQVFSHGGFDCVLGNPPWEIVQDREGGVDENMLTRQKIWFGGGIYSVISGRRDLYKLFLILATKLLNTNGYCGFVLPVGFMFEDDCSELRKEIFNNGSVISILHLQNSQKRFFPDVHASYRFLAITLARFNTNTHRFSAIVKSPTDLTTPPWYELKRNQFDMVLGEERSAILFNNLAQASLHQSVSNRIRRRLLLDYRVVAEFHASSDKTILTPRRESESDWALLKNGSFHHFNVGFGPIEKFVSQADMQERLVRKDLDPILWMTRSRLVFRDIARNDDTRTLIPCLVPPGFVSTYDAPMIVPNNSNQQSELALAFYSGYLTSFLADYLIRPFVDKHIKGYVLARIPIPEFDLADPLMRSAADISLNLAINSWRDTELKEVPIAFDHVISDRLKLEAIYLHLAAVTRDEIVLLFDAFGSIKTDDIRMYGEYRTQQLVLEMFDRMALEGPVSKPYTSALVQVPGQIVQTTYISHGMIRDQADARLAGLILTLIRQSQALSRQQITRAITFLGQPDSARQALLDAADAATLNSFITQYSESFTTDRLTGDRLQMILRYLENTSLIRSSQQATRFSAVDTTTLSADLIIDNEMSTVVAILLRVSVNLDNTTAINTQDETGISSRSR